MIGDDLRKEFDALLPGGSGRAGATRRGALRAALGVGYAAAALPIVAQAAIRTPADGLTVGEITFEVGGFQVPAYRAMPAGKTDLPIVLVVHEVFGVHEYIADVARRFAHAGYLAIAPELFARQGDPGQYGELARLMDEVVGKTPDAQVLRDLDGATAWAGAHGGDGKRTAIAGFCWGGRIAWLYAAHAPLRAAAAWYGRLAGTPSELTPRHPMDIAAKLKAPVLGLYGGADPAIPPESVAQMKASLAKGTAAAQASQFVVYPDAPHAFHADYRESYRAEAAEDSFRRALDWFEARV